MSRLQNLVRERRGLEPTPNGDPPIEDLVGLSLSGGGIRSATFCFGVLQALSAQGILKRVDLLSTVSGGGYIGAMLGMLFHKATCAADAARIYDAIAKPGGTWFQWWLRANGRYLVPRGARDRIFALALYIRNLVGVHFELGLLSLIVGSLMAMFNIGAWALAKSLGDDPGSIFWTIVRTLPSWLPSIALLLPLLILPAALTLAAAYWSVPWLSSARASAKERFAIDGFTTAVLGLVVGVSAALVFRIWTGAWPNGLNEASIPAELHGLYGAFQKSIQFDALGARLRVLLATSFLLISATWMLGVALAWYLISRHSAKQIDVAQSDSVRSSLTRGLSKILWGAFAFILIGAVDRAAWYLAFEFNAQVKTGLILAAFAAVARAALPASSDLKLRFLSTRTLLLLARILGIIFTLSLLVWWVAIVYRAGLGILFDADLNPSVEPWGSALVSLLFIGGLPALYLASTGTNLYFLNLSSLHGFYRARLTRAYLGAANSSRFQQPGALDVLDSMNPAQQTATSLCDVSLNEANDDIDFAAYEPQKFGGPVHLINCCINQTRDPRGGLFNQDRRGLALTVSPGGSMQVAREGWKDLPDTERLTLGGWTAISGAAFAPGLGPATRGGISALATLAAARLGYWWAVGKPSGLTGRFLKSLSLLHETVGNFPGTDSQSWFLTDGGHFDNTGGYALLAERAHITLVVDSAADPDYHFEDIENLVRKARIDLQTEIQFLRPAERFMANGLTAIGGLRDLASPDSDACMAVALVRYPAGTPPGVLVVIKPNVCKGLPADLVNFKRDNPLFPQQSTLDQFFSEAQWDAYFELGSFIGSRLTAYTLFQITSQTAEWFVPDTGAFKTETSPDKAKPSLRGALLPTAGQTLSFGAAATLALSIWAAVDAARTSHRKQVEADRTALDELAKLWGKLPAAAGLARGASPVKAAAPETTASQPASSTGATPAPASSDPLASDIASLATKIVSIGETLCPAGEADWFVRSDIARRAHTAAREHCRAQQRTWEDRQLQSEACETLMATAGTARSVPECLVPPTREAVLRRPHWYGFYNYSFSASMATAHPCDPRVGVERDDVRCDGLGSSPVQKEAAPTVSASVEGDEISQMTKNCQDVRIRVLVENDDLDTIKSARYYKERWEAWQLEIPSIINLVERAEALGRISPDPARVNAIEHAGFGSASSKCAATLAELFSLAPQEQTTTLTRERPKEVLLRFVTPLVPVGTKIAITELPSITPSVTNFIDNNQDAYKSLIDQFQGSDRRRASDRLVHLANADTQSQAQIVKALLSRLLREDAAYSYRVNLYILHTLAQMRDKWPHSEEELKNIQRLAKSANARDPTFRARLTAALDNAQ